MCLLYPLADGFSGFKIVPWSYIVFLTSECAARHVSLPYELSKLPFACTQLASCLLPISLWCRGVVENFGPGTDGLFQLWLESVSNKLNPGFNDRVLSCLDPRASLTFCPGLTSPWQYLLSWAWSLLPSIWSPFISLWSSDRFSCSGKLLFQFLTWLQNTPNPFLSVSKMLINFAGCLRLSRGTVTCWTQCLSSSQGWQASVWP